MTAEPIKYWVGLEDTVRRLVQEGKNSRDPEFQAILSWFKLDRIKAMVEKIKKETTIETSKGTPYLQGVQSEECK